MDVFQGNLDFSKMMDSDEREFKDQLSTMSIDQAIQLAQAGTKAAQTGAAIGAASQIMSGGLQAYAAYDKDQQNQERIKTLYKDDPTKQAQALDMYSKGLWYPQDGKI
jgi:hypothetical protein